MPNYRFSPIIKISILLIFVFLGSCKTRELKRHIDTETFLEKKSDFWRIENTDFGLNEKQEDYKFRFENLSYDFTLKSQDSTQPAVITEYREGKPYRVLTAKNAVYNEHKKITDSTKNKKFGKLNLKYSNLLALYSQQNLRIKKLEQENERLKIEGNRLANNFKYALWFLLSISLIWICERTGLFRWFKTVLNAD